MGVETTIKEVKRRGESSVLCKKKGTVRLLALEEEGTDATPVQRGKKVN